MYSSQAVQLGQVSFPAFNNEKHYMRKFTKKSGLPSDLKHWQPTVDAMLQSVDTDNPIYIMIDQAPVYAGALHRRGGPHIDGYWNEVGHDVGHSSRSTISCHGGYPTPHHGGEPYYPPSRHVPSTPMHGASNSGWDSGKGNWSNATLDVPEAIILASNYPACRGWIGKYKGSFGEGGDCSKIDLTEMEEFELQANTVYVGSVGFVHQSIPVKENVLRTLVRLNVKEWEPAFN